MAPFFSKLGIRSFGEISLFLIPAQPSGFERFTQLSSGDANLQLVVDILDQQIQCLVLKSPAKFVRMHSCGLDHLPSLSFAVGRRPSRSGLVLQAIYTALVEALEPAVKSRSCPVTVCLFSQHKSSTNFNSS
jgi:hypothetical protein